MLISNCFFKGNKDIINIKGKDTYNLYIVNSDKELSNNLKLLG